MSISLESGACPNCGFENSVHISERHNCHRRLPWAGSEATRLLTQPLAPTNNRAAKTGAAIWQIVGCIVMLIGVLLWLGNVSGTYRTFPTAGFFTMVGGSGILGHGFNKMFDA